jgi:hypothetical protein
MICTVHDDIVLDCPTEEVDDVAQMCYGVFDDISTNISRIWKVEVPIKFPGEVYKGMNLKDLEPVERRL